MKLALVILVIIVIALAVVVFAFVEEVPPTALTRTCMTVTEGRIHDYAATHHHLPSKLSDLPRLADNRNDSIIDGWGNAIQYEVDGQSVTLLGLGKDGLPGGDGQNADIKSIFIVSEP
jgi:hypothetical protein